MPRHLDTSARVRDLADAVHRLVLEGGLAAVTYRALGEAIGCSASSIHDHFPRLTHLLTVVAVRTQSRRLQEAAVDVRREGLGALLPRTTEDRERHRVWLSLLALSTTEEQLEQALWEARCEERRVVAGALGRPVEDRLCEAVHALLTGLALAAVLPSPAPPPGPYPAPRPAVRDPQAGVVLDPPSWDPFPPLDDQRMLITLTEALAALVAGGLDVSTRPPPRP